MHPYHLSIATLLFFNKEGHWFTLFSLKGYEDPIVGWARGRVRVSATDVGIVVVRNVAGLQSHRNLLIVFVFFFLLDGDEKLPLIFQ